MKLTVIYQQSWHGYKIAFWVLFTCDPLIQQFGIWIVKNCAEYTHIQKQTFMDKTEDSVQFTNEASGNEWVMSNEMLYMAKGNGLVEETGRWKLFGIYQMLEIYLNEN